jgi:hypothetical protein
VRTFALSLLVCSLLLCGRATGQLAPYNPYAPTNDDPLPVRADGKLNWPAFYKDKAMQDRFQDYFKIGACVGTNPVINNQLKNNKVDVNGLPETAVEGRAVSLTPGIVTLTGPLGQKALVVTHPAGVSKVNVSGPMPLRHLKADMIVRFVGRVDAHGMGTDPVDALEVVTPDANFKWPEIDEGKVETVTAKVVKLNDHRLLVQVPSGKLKRLTYMLADDPKITVDSSSLALTAAGDAVAAKGHSYAGAGAGGMQVVFASEVTVNKGLGTFDRAPVAPKPAAAPNGQ